MRKKKNEQRCETNKIPKNEEKTVFNCVSYELSVRLSLPNYSGLAFPTCVHCACMLSVHSSLIKISIDFPII